MITRFRNLVFGPPFLYQSVVTLTDAQFKALPTTGITIVTPGRSGYRIRPFAASLVSRFSAGAYTNVNATYCDLRLEVGVEYVVYCLVNDSAASPALSQMTNFTGAADKVIDPTTPEVVGIPDSNAAGVACYILPNNNVVGGSSPTVWDNQPLVLKADNNGSGNFTGGNAANTLKVTTYYAIEKL